ncbi:MAG: signal peptide peptidase SppA [Brevundimonas sp.]
MKQFFLTLAGVFAGLVLFVIVTPIALIALAAAGSSAPATSPNTVLELDLREGLTDQPPTNPFAAFGGAELSVLEVVDALDRAEDDRNVKAVLIRLPEMGMTPAAADEVRQAVRRFRASGKPVIAHSQGFLPVGAVMSSYMVGASASELWMQNTSSFQVTGFAAEEIFLGDAFRRYGVTADFEQRYEYKNAVNVYTENDFTPAHREAMLSWMRSIYDSALANAAADRRQTPAAMRQAIESGPHSAERAVALKLVDKIGQVEEAEAEAKRRAGRNAQLVSVADYVSNHGLQSGSGSDAVAIVNAEGTILTGRDTGGGFGSGSTIYSDDTAAAIYEAIENDAVKAIVIRVSSPGGSPDASEQILAAVRAAKAAGKPVVVSMGTYATSGGYWISAEASAIVAQPSTLTGSIGVFGGKFVLSEALGRFGVDIRSLAVGGEYADAFSPVRPFEGDRAGFASVIDRTYDDFIARVAAGRRLPEARVREIARGRVWTGAQARQLGLVDELGGLHEAIARAKALAEIPADQSVRLIRYPTQKSPFEALSEAFGVSAEGAEALVAVGGVLASPEAQGAIARARTEQLRARGASVLADQPVR